MKYTVYGINGKEKESIDLPESIFGLKWNNALVHQVAVGMMANARSETAHTKDRGEVSGGGKKPWKQKGTGRARHGSTRSPIWVGGGIAHGPRNDKSYSQKINKKMKVKALFTVLSQKLRDGQILFVEDFNVSKTKDADTTFKNLSKITGFSYLAGKRTRGLCTLPTKNDTLFASLKNLPQITVENLKNINPVDILNHKYLVIISPKESISLLEKKLG